MKNKLAEWADVLALAFKTPHTMKSAKRNVWVWSFCSLLAAVNIAMNVQLQSPHMWVWLAVNVLTIWFDLTLLRWTVHGYFWRKETDKAVAQWEEIVESYKL